MLLLLSLFACSDKSSDSAELVEAPTVSWLTPTDNGTVSAGEVACSLVVGEFTLEDPAKHNDGAPIGYVVVAVDGAEGLTTGSTTFNLSLPAGAHSLSATLVYADGDEVTSDGEHLCDEGAAGCASVSSTITVTAE